MHCPVSPPFHISSTPSYYPISISSTEQLKQLTHNFPATLAALPRPNDSRCSVILAPPDLPRHICPVPPLRPSEKICLVSPHLYLPALVSVHGCRNTFGGVPHWAMGAPIFDLPSAPTTIVPIQPPLLPITFCKILGLKATQEMGKQVRRLKGCWGKWVETALLANSNAAYAASAASGRPSDSTLSLFLALSELPGLSLPCNARAPYKPNDAIAQSVWLLVTSPPQILFYIANETERSMCSQRYDSRRMGSNAFVWPPWIFFASSTPYIAFFFHHHHFHLRRRHSATSIPPKIEGFNASTSLSSNLNSSTRENNGEDGEAEEEGCGEYRLSSNDSSRIKMNPRSTHSFPYRDQTIHVSAGAQRDFDYVPYWVTGAYLETHLELNHHLPILSQSSFYRFIQTFGPKRIETYLEPASTSGAVSGKSTQEGLDYSLQRTALKPRAQSLSLSHLPQLLKPGFWTQPAFSLRGGFRYLTIALTSVGGVSISNISCEISFMPHVDDMTAYTGYFYAKDSEFENEDFLTKLWYAGAYTVQTNTVPVNTGRQVPFESQGRAKRDRAVWPGDMGIAVPTQFVSTFDLLPTKNALSTMFAHINPTTGALPESGPPLSQLGSDTYHCWTMIGSSVFTCRNNLALRKGKKMSRSTFDSSIPGEC
ncbi:hypothetical protein D9757_007907 [Collybiopsis confluens]|uniref:Uncharacterized protein n=1 Tax=Collybiopsis confluens TaxID=2823264 RepID=A0A8H5M585_9AGAR|nr:hypothetical protein D9757_007907 [Collybiopsis confluens]